MEQSGVDWGQDEHVGVLRVSDHVGGDEEVVGVAGQEVELQGLKVSALAGGQGSQGGQRSHGGQSTNEEAHETDSNTGINTGRR